MIKASLASCRAQPRTAPVASGSRPAQPSAAVRPGARPPRTKQHAEPTRHSTRPSKPPGEWWKVPKYQPHATPSPEPTPDEDASDDEQEQQEMENDETEQERASRVHSGQSTPDPRSLKQALARDDSVEWKAAADAEIEAHLANGI